MLRRPVESVLRNRGVRDVYLVCVDGFKGFPQAIETVFPRAQVQLCIVHMVRPSLNYVTWQDRRKVVADLKLGSRPTNGMSRSPFRNRPSGWEVNDRTVLARKGPLRRGKPARPSALRAVLSG